MYNIKISNTNLKILKTCIMGTRSRSFDLWMFRTFLNSFIILEKLTKNANDTSYCTNGIVRILLIKNNF